MKIEKVKRVGSSSRFHVYADSGYAGLFLDEMLVVYGIKTGAEFDDAEFAKIKCENDKKVAFDLAASYLETYTCSEQGLKKYLAKKGYSAAISRKVVAKLREYGLLNDEKFAQEYALSLSKKFGKRAIRQKLKEKGIPTEIVDEILCEIDDDAQIEAATALAEKFFKNRQKDPKIVQKCFAHLAGKGYDYSVARKAIENLTEVEGDWS